MPGGYRVDLGWARSASSIFDRAAGAVVDRRRGPSPLVHGGPSRGVSSFYSGPLAAIYSCGRVRVPDGGARPARGGTRPEPRRRFAGDG
jgi:hypothetical protein